MIRTGWGRGDCGVPFVEGDRYLIYGDLSDGNLYTSICSRTAWLHRAHKDLGALAKRSRLMLSDSRPERSLFATLTVVAVLCILVVE